MDEDFLAGELVLIGQLPVRRNSFVAKAIVVRELSSQ